MKSALLVRSRSHSSLLALASLPLVFAVLNGCGSSDDDGATDENGGTSGSGSGSVGTGGTVSLGSGAATSSGGTSGGGDLGTGALGPGEVPEGFTKANVGGYKLGEPIDGSTPSSGGSGGGSSEGCGTAILAVVRDFTDAHPDFERQAQGDDLGIVKGTLGADRKPVYNHDGPTRTVLGGPESFAQWFVSVPGVNEAFTLQMYFEAKDGVTSFQSTSFFPLDGQGLGDQGRAHNFHFTTEIHTTFKYSGGEVFNFTGDDDVWVFINNKLVIDLGGVHSAETKSLKVDEIAASTGIKAGSVYPFDMFQAERHTNASNFRADTNLNFVDCGIVVADPS